MLLSGYIFALASHQSDHIVSQPKHRLIAYSFCLKTWPSNWNLQTPLSENSGSGLIFLSTSKIRFILNSHKKLHRNRYEFMKWVVCTKYTFTLNPTTFHCHIQTVSIILSHWPYYIPLASSCPFRARGETIDCALLFCLSCARFLFYSLSIQWPYIAIASPDRPMVLWLFLFLSPLVASYMKKKWFNDWGQA